MALSLPADSAEGIQGAGSCRVDSYVPGAFPGRSHSLYAGARTVKNEEKGVRHGKAGKVSETGDPTSGRQVWG